MGLREAAALFGISDKTFRKRLTQLPKIRFVRDHRGRKLVMEDVFSALFPEANQYEIYQLMLQYRMSKTQDRERESQC